MTSNQPPAMTVDQAMIEAVALHQQGQLAGAEALYRAVLNAIPGHPDAACNLAQLALQLGHHEAALTLFDVALRGRPDFVQALANSAVALHFLGRSAAASCRLRQVLALLPGETTYYFNLAQILSQSGREIEAIRQYEKTLRLAPTLLQARLALGELHGNLGHAALALDNCRQGLAFYPEHVDLWVDHGRRLSILRPDAAAPSFRRAVTIAPADADLRSTLANARQQSADLVAARHEFRCALALVPAHDHALAGLGNVEADLKSPRAAATYGWAIALAPRHAANYLNAGSVDQMAGRLDVATASYQRALALEPALTPAWHNLGSALALRGSTAAALTCFSRALTIAPWRNAARSSFLFTASITRTLTPQAERRLAADWETHWLTPADRTAARDRRFTIVRRPGDRLRIGITSAEFGQHPVAYFLEPILAAMDRRRVELHLYPISGRHDAITDRFRRLGDQWTPLWNRSDAEAAALVRNDSIDILIDTTSHTSGSRLGIFAHRAAPVQCHYIGYHGTSGLTEMDYFIGDDIITPPEFASHFTERLWRLPRLWMAYNGPDMAPEPAWQPAADGRLRLGSFNNLMKVGSQTLEVWAHALRALPDSVLVLKDRYALDPATQARIAGTLARHGVAPDRIHFIGPVASWADHMAVYDTIDIALDTQPFNSATTAFDALWMGVPLIAMKGDWMGARITASMLTALGRTEWVAEKHDYTAKLLALAQDADRRRMMRAGQRQAMRDSMLCDATGLARALETAFTAMLGSASEGP